MPWPPPRLLLGLAALPSALLLRSVDPAVSGLFPPCAILTITGWYCSGCGTARALHALSHGHFLAAFQLNALAVVVAPLVLLAIAGDRTDVFRRLGSRAIWMLLAVIVLFGVLRNIPAWPFDLLAPR